MGKYSVRICRHEATVNGIHYTNATREEILKLIGNDNITIVEEDVTGSFILESDDEFSYDFFRRISKAKMGRTR